MFWLALTLGIIMGLLSRALIRKFLQNFFPKFSDGHFDIVLIVLLSLTATLSILQYLNTEDARWKRAAQFRYDGSFVNACIGGDYLCSNLMMGTVNVKIEKMENSEKSDVNISLTCDKDSYQRWHKAIAYDDTFPFPYYYLYLCYKRDGLQEWKNYYKKGKSILEKTIKVDNCNDLQKFILNEMNEDKDM